MANQEKGKKFLVRDGVLTFKRVFIYAVLSTYTRWFSGEEVVGLTELAEGGTREV